MTDTPLSREEYDQIAGPILHEINCILDDMKAERRARDAFWAPLDLSDPHLARQNRLMPNLLALWRRCERPACRRARACRGIARHCVDRHAAAVPEPVREGVEILLRGRRSGASYETIRQAAPKPLAAIDTWLSLAAGPLRRRARAPAGSSNAIFTFR